MTCYYPDKSIASGFKPCNSTLAGPNGAGSACCAAGEICTTGGFCINDLYYPYRGACTDKSWNSNNCAGECVNVNPSKNVQALPCADKGTFGGLFCCSANGTESCCNATFGNVFGIPFAPTALAATTANETCSTNTSAIATVTATPTGHSSSELTKVGVGVGVPLGLLLLLSLIFAAWTERRRRRDMERATRGTIWTGGKSGNEKSHNYAMNGSPQEVEGGEREILELGDGEVHEVRRVF